MSNKTRIEFDGFDEVISKLKRLDGDIRGTTEKALTKTHSYVTKIAKEAIQKSNLPAKGKYSKGTTEKSLVKNAEITWEGFTASVKTGFSIKNGGLASIFLMYGTPRMKPDKKLYSAFYGSKTKKEIKSIQEDTYYDEIRRLER